jgi:hypothetical protein
MIIFRVWCILLLDTNFTVLHQYSKIKLLPKRGQQLARRESLLLASGVPGAYSWPPNA